MSDDVQRAVESLGRAIEKAGKEVMKHPDLVAYLEADGDQGMQYLTEATCPHCGEITHGIDEIPGPRRRDVDGKPWDATRTVTEHQMVTCTHCGREFVAQSWSYEVPGSP